MADETKRVIDQTTDTSLSAGDFIIVDSESEGTRKFDLGTELTDIKQDLQHYGLSDNVKQALLDCFKKVAWIDQEGQDYYDALFDAIYPEAESISCVYTQTAPVYTTYTLNSLKLNLVVTAIYEDGTTKTLASNEYSLDGELTAGTSTITVIYGDLRGSFNVTVLEDTLSSISATYTQTHIVFNSDSLDSLKSDLAVYATYVSGNIAEVSSDAYTLSGSLTVGTSTITVTYQGKTATFTVVVNDEAYFSYANGDLLKDIGAILSNDGPVGVSHSTYSSTDTQKRRSFFFNGVGETLIPDKITSSTYNEGTYYPVPVPDSATQITVSITPSTMYVATTVWALNDGMYSVSSASAWSEGSVTIEFESANNLWATIVAKKDSGGNNFTTEPTELTIEFS